jgi:hypothetical protein
MPKLNKPVLIDMYDSGLDFLNRAAKEGIQSELGAINKKPSKEELSFRLKELYTIGNVIANIVKTLIELQYLVDTQKPKNYQALKTRIKKYDLGTIARAYDMWVSAVINLLRLYEVDEDEGLIFSKENLTNKFTDNDLYKINKTLTRDMGVEEVFAELGKRQTALHDMIVDLGEDNANLTASDLVQKNSEVGQIDATLGFPNSYPVITITDTGDELTLNSWVSKDSDPYRIIDWCLTNRNGSFVHNSIVKKELSLTKGVNEVLRKSTLSPTSVLGAFITTDESQKKIKVCSEAKLTSQQLANIKAVSS